MDFENGTPLPAALYRSQLNYRDLMLATVIVKASYEVAADGAIGRVGDPLPINEADVETPFGTLEGDVVPIKDGCDFAIYGHALSRQPVATMNVTVELGSLTRALRITGDRLWASSDRAPASSEGAAFTSMPLDYSHAFGGSAVLLDGEASPYPDNPSGRGWIAFAEHAVGTPLPNVEEDDQLVTRWDQRPLPASLLPLPRASYLRGSRGIVVDVREGTTSMNPLAFNFSHPRMHLGAFPGGEILTVRGMTPEPSWSIRVPTLDLALVLSLGGKSYELRLLPDTLCVVPAHRRLWTVFRRAFVYQVVPERKRQIRIEARSARDDENTITTIAAELGRPNPRVTISPPDEPERMPLPWDMLRASHPLTSIIETLPLCASG
jgi:hypothetical protein